MVIKVKGYQRPLIISILYPLYSSKVMEKE